MNEKAEENEGATSSDKTEGGVGPAPAPVETAPGMYPVETHVEFIQPRIHGYVKEYHLSDDKKTFTYIVEYVNEKGELCERGFTHDQLKAI
jgi:hypothetical protein